MEVLRKEKEEEASVNEKKIDIEPHAAFGSQQVTFFFIFSST